MMTNNAFTLLEDGSEDNEDLLGEELRNILIEYIAGRYENKSLNEYIKGLDWYVDNANDYDYEMETPLFWTEEKNTLAYRSTNHVAIGAEMYELPIFTEYDDNGDLCSRWREARSWQFRWNITRYSFFSNRGDGWKFS